MADQKQQQGQAGGGTQKPGRKKVRVWVTVTPSGQGNETMVAQVVADLPPLATALRRRGERVDTLIGRSPAYGTATTYSALGEIISERFALSAGDAPAPVREAASRFRYGRGEMQIHLAMNELPRWRGDERLARTPLLHLTPGLDGVSRAVNEADRGLLLVADRDRHREAPAAPGGRRLIE